MTYDYVIVGAGSSGCVLAARLSEDPEAQVVLIEAGGADAADEIHIPAAFGSLFKSRFDWDMQTEPEPGLDGRRGYLPRAKVLGGCSSMNAMVYIRGNRADYDEWAAGGATGWGYDDVLPYFRRSENNLRGEDQYHGTGGPLDVRESVSMHPLATAFVEAARQAGHEANPDFNGARQEGVGRFQVTQRDGLRWSTAAAFLRPAMERDNLTVITDALCAEVLFDGTRATGVRVIRGGVEEDVLASSEVILSAGAYQSPQLLMLSGIGPADSLPLLQIDVREDLPVGKGLQDHFMALFNVLSNTESLMTALTPENVAALQRGEGGPLSSNVAEAGGFMRTRPGLDGPDVQFHCAPVMFHQDGLGAPFDHAIAFGPGVVKPTSRGEVTLRSGWPDAKPRILHNYLTTEEDRQSLIAGCRIALDILAQPAMQAVVKAEYLQPADDSDEGLLAFSKQVGMTIFHPTSTCAIGQVVDPELRVYGVEGLRVVDCSVMPSIIRGNTNAPAIMIAEKAADMIVAS